MQIPAGYLLADLEVADAPRKDERDDRLANGVQIRKREQAGARALSRRRAWRSSLGAHAPERAGAERLVPQIVGIHAGERAAGDEQDRGGPQGRA